MFILRHSKMICPSVKMSTLGLRPHADILTSGHIILECRTDHHASYVYCTVLYQLHYEWKPSYHRAFSADVSWALPDVWSLSHTPCSGTPWHRCESCCATTTLRTVRSACYRPCTQTVAHRCAPPCDCAACRSGQTTCHTPTTDISQKVSKMWTFYTQTCQYKYHCCSVRQ